eukprot:14093679-Ditylum_brightwellii.AAC.1
MEMEVQYQIGVWGREMEGNSSNLQELRNEVDALEEETKAGKLTEVEAFLFRGTWMIQQGTDGLSHRNLSEGVMKGKEFMGFMPLHKTACEVHPPLRELIVGWAPWETEFLDATEWFEHDHDIDGGSYQRNTLWYQNLKPG